MAALAAYTIEPLNLSAFKLLEKQQPAIVYQSWNSELGLYLKAIIIINALPRSSVMSSPLRKDLKETLILQAGIHVGHES